jgi:uncharacterized protein
VISVTSAQVHIPNTTFVELAPDPHTQPFWDAARQHHLELPRCRECGVFVVPPTGYCPACRRQDYEWVQLSGRATLYAYTVVWHPVVPALSDTVPYVLAVVKLPDAGDAKLVTNIIDCEIDDLRIGQELEVVWTEHSNDFVLPRFRPLGRERTNGGG